ncbi:pantoate--beta-alanine ligase [Desulfotomaculum copahuensis]|uniref:Pantothenate synthetase n=1 Tax=Desulfotomaculum copahuensis TaxID=1838280 RepID=A0A1B7LCS0_9FIRM|nr:pantoate--beta-alanine ligase [Desulfotomaculum copahuensis]OAT80711.1 pantoate--beta-alanine ligase [Desulfotomaculum copahuensis]
MHICRTVEEIRAFVRLVRARGQTAGLVPTMGYFHQGHLSLMRRAGEVCDAVVVSIFVNPLQFGPQEDFERYPRDFERDAALAEEAGVDAVFVPPALVMYPPGFATHVEVGRLTGCLCGASRPGHFRGVATVVNKLFNIVQPDRAFFGQKDAQQVLVIRRMAADLNLPLEIEAVPTVREADGLAMSSRNVYLDPEQRRAAPVLYQSLQEAEKLVQAGERNAARLRGAVLEKITGAPGAQVDYVEIRSLPDLEPLTELRGPALLALAVRFGATRLIDNTVLNGGVSDL